jgi:hypothetical protein
MRQLRERNEPIRLFGESDAERRARLQYIKTHESSDERGMPEICLFLTRRVKVAMVVYDLHRKLQTPFQTILLRFPK